MVQAYNFLASWQLFPEKGIYENGERPKSGIYKIESSEKNKKEIIISHNWVSLENHAFNSRYTLSADGDIHEFEGKDLADHLQARFIDSINFEIHFYKSGQVILHVVS